ncbi:hypothetical protein [Allorhizocola rhizosphaerae]|uniref:hypothetical protein n=1 Tax=Allorhizocola rhizosphaerae TaxID=1872709 RepID=UPI000E3EBA88|nr:hypothetical protein [Allorhizocola rhizosphaerae]
MRIRLFAGAAAAVALLALTACRSAPNVAIYIGDAVITEQQVTELVDGYNAIAPADRKVTREVVVEYALGEQLCDRAAKAKGFTYQPRPAQAQTPAFLAMAGRFEACLEAMPVSPASEAEMRALYEREVDEGRLSPDVKFDDVRASIEGNQNLQRQLSWTRTLDEQAKAADVVVNPRYAPPFGAANVVRTVQNRPIAPQQPQQPQQ